MYWQKRIRTVLVVILILCNALVSSFPYLFSFCFNDNDWEKNMKKMGYEM